MTAVESFAELAKEVLARPARLGEIRMVAVDGPSGAGKTTFAERLARALRAGQQETGVVHTDELLDGWGDQFTFWTRLDETVLNPLAHGEPGRHPVYDWALGRFDTVREVPVPEVLIVEGGTSARPEAYPRLSFSIFVDADRDLRLARVLARDGPAVEAPLRRWMAAEERHFAAARTAERADRLVDGGLVDGALVDGVARVGHDPESGYVRLR